jgi:hypothetical protein
MVPKIDPASLPEMGSNVIRALRYLEIDISCAPCAMDAQLKTKTSFENHSISKDIGNPGEKAFEDENLTDARNLTARISGFLAQTVFDRLLEGCRVVDSTHHQDG